MQAFDGHEIDLQRLRELATKYTGGWVSAIPNPRLDQHLSNDELMISICIRLGVKIVHGNTTCIFCDTEFDEYGHHGFQCNCKGQLTRRHNTFRDFVHHLAVTGGFSASKEKDGLVADDDSFNAHTNKRPADNYIENFVRGQHYALDEAVISPFTQNALNLTRKKVDYLTAYANKKRERIAGFRKVNDFVFQPMVISALGAWKHLQSPL
jgi:hypothetical protein